MSDRPLTSTDTELLNQLRSLTADLVWMSEADYPFEVFIWDDMTKITPEQLNARTGHSPDTPVKVIGVDEFFRPCTTSEDWHNDEEAAEVKRYQELVSFLKQNLKDIQIYRVGEIEIDIYIIGQYSGQLVGLKTKAVET
jgi:hypothetical protein